MVVIRRSVTAALSRHHSSPLALLLNSLLLLLLLSLPFSLSYPDGEATTTATTTTSSSSLPDQDDWINHSFLKQLELSGSVSSSVLTVQISPSSSSSSPTQDSFSPYYFTLPSTEAEAVSWAKAILKSSSQREVLQVESHGPLKQDASTHLFSVRIPKSSIPSASASSPLTLILETTLNHLSYPLPSTVKQNGEMFLQWTGDAAIRSPYRTEKGRVKVKCPHPKILSFHPDASQGATKSGSTITFGSYEDVAPYTPGSEVKTGSVHYQHVLPVISMVELDRLVEISHWGDNMATEDKIWLRNDGAKLKGHFSRIDHQMATFYSKANSHVLSTLAIHLPPGSKEAYFTDSIGNVSTSHFRPSPSAPYSLTVPSNLLPPSRVSVLEIQPRFPVLGGWNYTFTIGWNNRLGEGGWGKSLGSNEYLVAVPFLTPVTDVAMDQVRTKIVLPEGATDIQFEVPFEMDSISTETHTTYLDTKGRPSIVLSKSQCSEKHGSLIYVRYTLTPSAHLRKPIAITAISIGLLLSAALLLRFDVKIR